MRRPVAATATERQVRMLRTAMGPVIAAALEDPEVVEVLLNPDGSLWLDRLRTGRERTDVVLPADDAERILRLVAAHMRLVVHRSDERRGGKEGVSTCRSRGAPIH